MSSSGRSQCAWSVVQLPTCVQRSTQPHQSPNPLTANQACAGVQPQFLGSNAILRQARFAQHSGTALQCRRVQQLGHRTPQPPPRKTPKYPDLVGEEELGVLGGGALGLGNGLHQVVVAQPQRVQPLCTQPRLVVPLRHIGITAYSQCLRTAVYQCPSLYAPAHMHEKHIGKSQAVANAQTRQKMLLLMHPGTTPVIALHTLWFLSIY